MILAVDAGRVAQARRLLERLGEPHWEVGRVIRRPRGATTRVLYQ
jgi:phosphoribosylaminoimidazole (AIR) synthetase